MGVNQQVLDAIELLMQSSVKQAGYDKTIQAQIISCEDPTIGKYKCRYQDAIFYAYTGNTDITLSKGANVYILVPENDMSKDKTIIGMVDKLGTNYISMAVGEQAYDIIGNNCISMKNAYPNFYLDIDNIDYSFDIYNADRVTNYVDLDIAGLNQYIRQSSSLIVGAKIKTEIPATKQQKGHYGISYNLQFIDENNNTVIRSYTVNEDNMVDNPYDLAYPTRQYAIYDIDGQHFNRVQSITIFNSGFPDAVGSVTGLLSSGQITLSDLQIKGAVRMSEEQINGLALSFFTPQGTLFINSGDSPKTIQALVKVKGQVVTAAQNVSFYWGVEDVSITPVSQYYNKYLGHGWKCLNEYNTITSEDSSIPLIEWFPYGDTYTVSFGDATAYNNRFKVAAIYDENVITKQINIQNLTVDSDFIQITSTSGDKFYYGVGITTLICEVKNASSYNNLTYKWAWQNNGGLLQNLTGTVDFIDSIQGNVLTNVQIRKIYNFGTFKCTVYDGNVYLGTGSITLTNSMEGEGANPLIIHNGAALYKYNEKGVSPISRGNEKTQLIQALTFSLYDDAGNQILSSNDLIQNNLISNVAKVKWCVPNHDTLLAMSITADESDDEYNYYNNLPSLAYEIASRYNSDYVNNQIRLEVTYQGATSISETTFTFTKQGNIGTNGTQYYVKIIPNTIMQVPPQHPMITKVNGGNYILNYGLNSANNETSMSSITNQSLFKVQMWKSDQKVYETGWSGNLISPTVEWSILRNHYWGTGSSSVDDATDFSINAETGAITYVDELQNNSSATKANIIKCSITYEQTNPVGNREKKTYYGLLPVITAYVTNNNYRLTLKDNTGFTSVMYSSDGMSPQYDNAHPFELIYKENNQEVTSDITYVATEKGDVKYKNGSSTATRDSGNLTKDEHTQGLASNQFVFDPSSRYFGECVNNSVQFECQKSGAVVGRINIPIHFFLNSFGLANINAWDGNNVQINEEQGYILAPQMGAGQKDSNNRFTGVLMGTVKDPAKNQQRVGLFGYAAGAQSFFLNSQNGSAIFGKSTKGQIIIDPASENAMLYSGNYWSNYNTQTGLPSSYSSSNEAGAGMLIDLTTPRINFGNGGFSVDNQGNLITGQGNFKVTYQGAISAGKIGDTNNYNFTVDTSGNVTMTGAITANSGKIGGINGWTIGSDTNRGYIYSGSRNSLDSTASGLYVGTDGISAYKSGTGITFKVDSDGNVTINGSITMGSGSSISWSVLQDAGAVNSRYVNSAIDDAIDDLDIPVLPSYIKSTYIDSTTIQSPTIYAGRYYATGDGRGSSDSGAAYYIYDGLPTQSGSTKIGYISYDSDGSGLDENQHRVKFRTVGATALKLQSGLDLSIQTGAWNDNADAALNNYQIYLMSQTSFDRAIFLREETSGIWRTYGNTLPSESAMGWQSTGRLFFLLD